MSRRIPKTVTYEIEFTEDYPNGAPYCRHGPAIRLKVINRMKTEKVSYKWACSFDRDGNCPLKAKEEMITKSPVSSSNEVRINPNWQKDFKTRTNDKGQGQYFFDKETIGVITRNMVPGEKIILLGCPTLLIPMIELNFDAVLLDIDERFENIFPSKYFKRFNMTNCHFLSDNDEAWFRKFRDKGDKVTVISDPPFGMMVNVLMRTINLLCKNGGIYVFFPWFNDSRFHDNQLRMSDYKVRYEKHSKMNRNNTVRIFSNRLQSFKLGDGYKYCSQCLRYVSNDQFHCKKCDSCCDRSGRGVKHCQKCKLCTVKSHQHCDKCNQCKPKDHICVKKTVLKCFSCNKVGHMEKDCHQIKRSKTYFSFFSFRYSNVRTAIQNSIELDVLIFILLKLPTE